MPAGRPTKYNEEVLRQAKILYRKGFTDAEVAETLGVDESTITEWKQVHPEFSASLKDWKDEADHKVERSLYERAQGYMIDDKFVPPDTTACIFWLKNRKSKQWRDKTEQEHSGQVNVFINRKPTDG